MPSFKRIFILMITCFYPYSHNSCLLMVTPPLFSVLVSDKSDEKESLSVLPLPFDSPPALFLLQYFRGSLCQSHQTYCLNYSAAVFYLESLRQRNDFGIYLKVKYHFLFFYIFPGTLWHNRY